MTRPTRFFDHASQEWCMNDFGMARWLAAHEARNRKPDPAPEPVPDVSDMPMMKRDLGLDPEDYINPDPKPQAADPYAELKAADAAGKRIQFRCDPSSNSWKDWPSSGTLKWIRALECYRIHPADDGWIDWHGGECPVAEGVVVEVTMPGGSTIRGTAGHFAAGTCDWWREGGRLGRIIAYRVVKA